MFCVLWRGSSGSLLDTPLLSYFRCVMVLLALFLLLLLLVCWWGNAIMIFPVVLYATYGGFLISCYACTPYYQSDYDTNSTLF
jgi:hypothetical protein